ncbi:hypothetical protein [Pseudorhodobacter sp.]|uniref:hypothetical protein n=1 Tax=Pseudorhodobacter sp. TaxID=1934400 RepID=UPI0039E2499D
MPDLISSAAQKHIVHRMNGPPYRDAATHAAPDIGKDTAGPIHTDAAASATRYHSNTHWSGNHKWQTLNRSLTGQSETISQGWHGHRQQLCQEGEMLSAASLGSSAGFSAKEATA